MELNGSVQNYAWGAIGLKSSVAKLTTAFCPNIKIDDNLPYAELWMGTHPNGPSIVKTTGDSLQSYLDKHPSCLGSNITEKFGNELCFLFKVLSVNQALSIQAHPEKSHAEQLHRDRPEVYKDPNHKPEMAIALTPFQALCGFRPANEILTFLSEIPELVKIIGVNNVANLKKQPTEENLKVCFSSLMNTQKLTVKDSLDGLVKRMSSLDEYDASSLLKDLFLTLHDQYPGDGGCFAIYFLNYIVLQPGEAMFLGPNVIHAYLNGDCMECMACSDNVVRAGLTPKYQDVDTLLAMLEYEMLPAELRKFEGTKVDKFTTTFKPPVPDFAVQKIQGDPKETVSLTVEKSASILIVINGSGVEVQVEPSNIGGVSSPLSLGVGSILFIQSEQKLSFRVENDKFLAFRALCLKN